MRREMHISSMWLRFRRSGFFFRMQDGEFVQGAYLTCDGDAKYAMCSPRSADAYKHRAEFWQPPEAEFDDLKKIPQHFMSGDNYAYALDIIAE